jgi:hypothetical protein
MLICDKGDYKPKLARRQTHSCHTNKRNNKGKIIATLYVPNVNIPNFIKQILLDLKAQISTNTMIVRDFTTPLSPIDKSSREKTNKETYELNDTINQMDSVDIYSVLHS